jgi:hypothetical protein
MLALAMQLLRNRFEIIQEMEIERENISNSNPNFMKEQDMNFRLYPFYINWKKLEANEASYFRTFIRYGYFGASIYSSFKEKYPSLRSDNILYVLINFIPEHLLDKDNKDEASQKVIKEYFEKIPNLDDICHLIEKKIIMFKEVPIILLVLKIYEIYYMLQKNNFELEKILKTQYLLGTYLTNEEYNEVYKHYEREINRIFRKLMKENGKEYELPKTKGQYFNHIKYVYKKKIKNE